MKLQIIGMENVIEFNDDTNTLLIIKDNHFFGKFIKLLNDISKNSIDSNEIVLIEQDKNILSSSIVIIDPFNIDLNSKKILNALYKQLNIDFQANDSILDFYNLLSQLNVLVSEFIEEYNLQFSFNEEFSFDGYLKFINLKIINNENENLFEHIIDFLEVVSELFPTTPLIFCNIFSFLSQEEITSLCKYKNYKHVNVLFIENKDFEITDFNKFIIDEDFFEYQL